ncbi:acyl-CoA thioesterase [Brevibacterium iodinum ATCC 49514]|uniref:Acyl-CoA thioesterase n=1 Tax=Brevibacterium iodinum ATCC 49514 TaxID=1255616 RepID=A0A2H1IUT5_9MICO|nr:hydroxyphenylacetyl-CoA thioesterase PaaI [Brevibacterium iodinum]SMX78890.1 acyl-CoA thioesterase [Brevibacterium iodinum ATCC 49514]SUW14209.1 Acyl-coenzyme A thioesterase PaaI [Brevibacterium iodinum]
MGQPTHDTTTAESQTPNTSTPTGAVPESPTEAAPQPDPTASTEAAPTEELTGAAAMFANDRASQHLGITVDDHGPGWAQCSMTVTDIMTNGHDITHGGYVFLFADTTFAMACNYPGSITVASGGGIDFLKPTYLGDELVARGHEVVKQGRSGIYDVTVTRGDEIIATYRGRSRTLPDRK